MDEEETEDEEEEEEADLCFLGVGFSRDWQRGLVARDARSAIRFTLRKKGGKYRIENRGTSRDGKGGNGGNGGYCFWRPGVPVSMCVISSTDCPSRKDHPVSAS